MDNFSSFMEMKKEDDVSLGNDDVSMTKVKEEMFFLKDEHFPEDILIHESNKPEDKLTSEKCNGFSPEKNDTRVKIENNEIEDMSFNEWQIKNEEINIRKEDPEQDESSVLTYFGHVKDEDRTVHKEVMATLDRIFICDICDYQTVDEKKLDKHFIQHKNSKKANMFKCDQCNYKTCRKGNLGIHFIRHQNPDSADMLKCDQCDFKTSYKSSLNRHVLLHTNPKEVVMFKCDECDYKTRYKSYLKEHFLRHKNPEEADRFKCDQCDFKTVYKNSMKAHLLRHENNN